MFGIALMFSPNKNFRPMIGLLDIRAESLKAGRHFWQPWANQQ